MSFFIRVWLQDDFIPLINSRDHEIEKDMSDISPATVIDAEVEGPYMDAGEVRDNLVVSGNQLTILGRTVLNQSVSQRP